MPLKDIMSKGIQNRLNWALGMAFNTAHSVKPSYCWCGQHITQEHITACDYFNLMWEEIVAQTNTEKAELLNILNWNRGPEEMDLFARISKMLNGAILTRLRPSLFLL